MLTLTTDATVMIEQILDDPRLPDAAGVRIALVHVTTDGDADAVAQLRMDVVSEPSETDEVIEDSGARLFVDDVLRDLLADKTLDASAVGEEIQFTLNDDR